MSRHTLSSLIFFCLFYSAFSCSCVPSSFKKNFCRSETSVKAKVVARTDNCPGACDPSKDSFDGRVIYIVRVLKVFKGAPIEDNIMYLNTSTEESSCGVELKIDATYLLNLGERQTAKNECPTEYWYIGLCHYPELWSSLSKEQMNFVEKNVCDEDFPTESMEYLEEGSPEGSSEGVW